MNRRVTARAFALLFACGSGGIVRAQEAAGAVSGGDSGTPAAGPMSVWYRSSADCPDAAKFLERVKSRGTNAELAGVGDAVDFVVTVGTSNGTSAGRLERQTARGTIAIRELSAPSCEEVAEALALSLALSAQERSSATPISSAPEATPTPAPSPVAVPAPSAARTSPSETDERPQARNPSAVALSQWLLGAQGIFATGIAPNAALGFGAFGEYQVSKQDFGGPSVRVSAIAARSDSETASGDLRASVITGRIDACPWALAGPSFRAAPCAAVELGPAFLESREPGGKADTRLWVSGLGLVRLSWLAGRWAIEAQAAAVVPFTHYRLTLDGSEITYETPALAFQAALGAGFRLP